MWKDPVHKDTAANRQRIAAECGREPETYRREVAATTRSPAARIIRRELDADRRRMAPRE